MKAEDTDTITGSIGGHEAHVPQHLHVFQRQLLLFAAKFVNVPLENSDAAIKHALQTVGGMIGADRAYLFEYDFASATASNTHEWCRDGICPALPELQKMPFSICPNWVATHLRGEKILIPGVSALDAADPLRRILMPQGIQSLVALPLLSQDGCQGFVGFDAVRTPRVLQQEEIDLLQVLAELFTNIQSRLRAERALCRTHHDLCMMLDTMDAHVWYVTDPETYGLANKAHADFLGVHRETLRNSPVRVHLTADDLNASIQANRNVFLTGQPCKTQEWLRAGNHERRLFEITRTPAFSADGHVSHVVSVAHDVTARDRHEATLSLARQNAEQAADNIIRLLADMSHDVRSPLNGILGSLQIMDRECDGCRQKSRVSLMRESGERLLRLLADSLTAARGDAGCPTGSSPAHDVMKAKSAEAAAGVKSVARTDDDIPGRKCPQETEEIPASFRSKITQAVRGGDISLLRILVHEIRAAAPRAALCAEKMIETYDYDSLLRLMGVAQKQSGAVDFPRRDPA